MLKRKLLGTHGDMTSSGIGFYMNFPLLSSADITLVCKKPL